MNSMKRGQTMQNNLMRKQGGNSSYGYLAFLLPFLVLTIGYATRLVFPFGDRQMLTVDLYHQYAPFLNELRDKILSGDGIFYSFAGGGGVNFYALFAYYLASPLNILLVIFPKAFLAESVLILTLIKVSLAGFTFNLLLNRAYLRKGPLSIAFSTMYALSSFQMAYAWNVMWLDAIYTMPLVILGLILLIRERNYWLYPVAVAYLLFVNYYMAMFVLIFTFFYFPIALFQFSPANSHWRTKLWTVAKTGALTLLGIGMSAILIWPTFKSLQLTSAAGDAFPKTVESTFDLINYVGQHFMLIEPTVRDGMPNLYAGVLLLLLVPIYFLANSIKRWQRVAHLALLAFLVISFNTNVLNFLWHGMHFPNQLPYRNSFVYIFFLVFLLYNALPAVKSFSNREIGFIGMGLVLLVLLIAPGTTLRFTPLTIYLTIFFIVLYMLVLTSFKTARSRRQPVTFILLSIIFFEMVIHTGGSLYYLDKNEYFGSRDGYAAGVTPEAIRKANEMLADQSDTLFYRTEILPDRTSNDPFLYDLHGTTIFASTMRKAGVTFFKNMGYSSNSINSYKYDGQTVLFDSLFSIRYLIHRSDRVYDERSRQLVLKNDEANVYVYQNPYTLPIAYMVDGAVLTFKSHDRSPFDNQLNWVQAMLPNEDVRSIFTLQPILLLDSAGGVLSASGTDGVFSFAKDLADAEATYGISWDTSEGATTYLAVDLRNHKGKQALITIDDREFTAPIRRSGIIELGYVPENANVEIKLIMESDAAISGDIELYIAQLSVPDLERVTDTLREQAIELTQMTSTRLEGTVAAQKNGMLMFTIPYDPGWSATVDGAQVEISEVDSSLMAIPVAEGEHTIVLTFQPDGFKLGWKVSALSVFLLVLLLVGNHYLGPKLSARRDDRQARHRLADGLQASLSRSGPHRMATDADDDGPDLDYAYLPPVEPLNDIAEEEQE